MKALLLFATSLSLFAQAVPADLAKQLDEIRSAPQSEWLIRTTRVIVPYLQDQIWDDAQRLSSRKMSKPQISIRIDAPEPAPFTTGDTIVFPAIFLQRAYLAAYLMAHDLYVEDGHQFPVPDPVLQRPYAVSPVLRSLPLALVDVKNPAALNLLTFLNCQGRDAECAKAELITVSSILLFFLGHEYGHIAAGEASAVSPEREKAADAWALKLMLAAAPNFAGNEDVNEYFFLGPPALFHILAAAATGDAKAELEARKAAFVAQLPAAAKSSFEYLTDASSGDGGMSSLAVQWTETPDWVAVDGIVYRPGDLANRRLRIPSGLHYIVAVAGQKLAYADVGAFRSAKIAGLEFRPFPAGEASAEQLTALRKVHKWGEIIAATATPNLEPRSAAVAVALFEALRQTCLGRFIHANALPADASTRDRRRVARWAKTGEPLAAWAP